MKTNTQRYFETIIRTFLAKENTHEVLAGIDAAAQFQPRETTPQAIARNVNAAFLLLLSGPKHPLYHSACDYLYTLGKQTEWTTLVEFYQQGVQQIHTEIECACHRSKHFIEELNALHLWMLSPGKHVHRSESLNRIQKFFFPEGHIPPTGREAAIQRLRKKRKIRISAPNPDPVRDPAQELLFTSNVLLTVPPSTVTIDDLSLSADVRQGLHAARQEAQQYWYDHPVQIGVAPEQNEVIYGLRGLQEALTFERRRGTTDADAPLQCVLSVSVTHAGLHSIAKPYLEDELQQAAGSLNNEHVQVYVFTEVETQRLLDEILFPAAEQYLESTDNSALSHVFGVDGEYGRHYSFLKAISAFWRVLINPELKGTFKIDLDQVFPQQELVEQTGASAFEHFCTPLWGACGLDVQDREVELGLLAGALVNERDIAQSLFTPDVTFPTEEAAADQLVFYSRIPQAVSTQAEMMTRYNTPELDGQTHCLQRIHITGGTNGILIDSLRKYRPFTPTFIGRAEDQAYLLSVLFSARPSYLRYVHAAGLIMRHDKEAFAGEAIKSARLGAMIGDYARILWYSAYADNLPWKRDDIKEEIDPFTGAFISRIPSTVAYLRMALRAAAFFADATPGAMQSGHEFVTLGARRLRDVIAQLSDSSASLASRFQREKQGWNLYYDILDALEHALAQQDDVALNLQRRAIALIKDTEVRFSNS